MKMKKFSKVEKTVLDMVEPIVTEQGFLIWDVSYEKEGACWYLRIFVDYPPKSQKDHPNGITIDDCETLTRPINAAIDRTPPIRESYILEVGSAGLERELNQPWHFEASIGLLVRAKSVRPINGQREWIGTLLKAGETDIILEDPNSAIPRTLPLAELSFVRRYVTVEF